tara:strand:- start:196 stop:882 length:687 start_codon:yes stop_codon:yes gene_type:complete
MITVVQNFICTKRKRLELLKSELPNMSKVFKDYEFFVNYGSIENVFEVGQVYEDNIKKLSFENNLEENWGEVTLGMVNKVKTPYTMVLCEDFEYRITYSEWKKMMDEFVERDVSYMPIGRLWKYTEKRYHGGYEEGKRLWFYSASKSPGSSLSVDAIYKTDMLKEKLNELQKYAPNRFPLSLPHHYEDIFHEQWNNGVKKWGDDVLCAVPKEVILMHIQEETETRMNK